MAERLARQVEAGFVAQRAAVGFHFGSNGGEVGGVGNDGDVFPVFRGGAHHGRPARCRCFQSRLPAVQFGLAMVAAKGIQVDAHEVNVADAVFFHFGDVFAQIAPTQNTAVDFRMQRFHSAVEHFGKTGIVGDFNHGNTRIGKQLRRAAGGKDFDTEFVQGLGKFDCAVFVGQADQARLMEGMGIPFLKV